MPELPSIDDLNQELDGDLPSIEELNSGLKKKVQPSGRENLISVSDSSTSESQESPSASEKFEFKFGEPQEVAAPKAVGTSTGGLTIPQAKPRDGIGAVDGFLNAVNRGMKQGEIADMLAIGKEPTRDDLKRISQLKREQAALPSSKAYEEFNKANTVGEQAKLLASDGLEIVSQLVGESLSAMLRHGYSRAAAGAATGAAAGSVVPGVGTVAGAGLGYVAGMGVAGYNIEVANSILESLQESGIDLTMEDSLIAGFNDPEKMEKARTFAVKRGVPIAIFDMISAGVAGKILGKPVKGLINKGLSVAGEAGIQSGLAGAGEAAAGLVSKGKISPTDIFAEMIGEVGGGAPDIIVGTIVEKKKNNQSVRKDIASAEIPQDQFNDMVEISEGSGEITSQQSDEIKRDYDLVQRAKEKTPEGFKTPEILEKVADKEELQDQLKEITKEERLADDSFKSIYEEKKAKIEDEINKITKTIQNDVDARKSKTEEAKAVQLPEVKEDIVEPLKAEEDAIQKRSTEEVPIPKAPTDSETVVEGVSQPEEPSREGEIQGEKNIIGEEKIITPDEKIAELKAKLAERNKGKLRSGPGLENLDIYTELAYQYIKKGAKSAVDFAKELGEDLSDVISKAWDAAGAQVENFKGFVKEGVKTLKENYNPEDKKILSFEEWREKNPSKYETDEQALEVYKESRRDFTPKENIKDVIKASVEIKPELESQVPEWIAFKETLKAREIGGKEGFKAGVKDIQARQGKIQEFFEANKERLKGKIPARVLPVLSKKISGIKSEASFNRAVEYIDKVLSNKEYAEKMSQISDLKAAVRSKIKSKSFGGKTELAKQLYSIDETSLDTTLDSYVEALNKLNRKGVPDFSGIEDVIIKASAEFDTPDINIVDKIVNKKDLDDAIKGLGDLKIDSPESFLKAKRGMADVRKKAQSLLDTGVITEEEYNKLVPSLDKKESGIENDLAKDLKGQIDKLTNRLIEEGKSFRQDIKWSEFNKYEQKSIKDFFNLDYSQLNKLGVNKADVYSKVAEQLTNGFISPKLHEIIVEVKSNEKAEAISKEIGEVEKIEEEKKNWLTDKFKKDWKDKTSIDIYKEIAAKPKQTIDNYLGFGKVGTFWNEMFFPINTQFNLMTKDIIDTQKPLNKASDKLSGIFKSKKDYDIKKQQVGLILKQIDYQKNFPDFESLPDSEKDITKWLLENKKSDYKGTGVEFLSMKDAYESLPKTNGIIDVEKAIKSLSPEQKKYMEEVQNIVKELKEKAKSAAESRGEIFVDEGEDYYPRKVKEEKIADPGDQDVDFLIGSDNQNLKLRAGSTYTRIKDARNWTETDPDLTTKRHIREVNRDFYLSDPIKIAMSAISKATRDLKDVGREKAQALKKLLKDTLVKDLNKRYVEDELGGLGGEIYSAATDLVLSTPLRIPKEFAPNVLKYALAKGEGFEVIQNRINKAAEYNKLFSDLGSGTMFKQSKYATEATQKSSESTFKKLSSLLATFSDRFTTTGGIITEFNKAFKEESGEKFSIKEYLSNPEYFEKNEKAILKALSVAEREVSVLSGTQSSMSTPSKVKINPFGKGLTAPEKARMFSWMQGYPLLENTVAAQAFRDVITGQNKGRLDAARQLSAVVAANILFQQIGYFTSNFIANSLDKDEEEPLKRTLQEMFEPKTQAATGALALFGLLTGGYTNLVRPFLGVALGLIDKFKDEGDKETLKIVNTIETAAKSNNIYPIRPDLNKLQDAFYYLGAFGIYMKIAMDAGGSAIDLYNLNKLVEKGGYGSLDDKRRDTYNMLVFLNAMFTLSARTTIPGAAEINRLLRESAKESILMTDEEFGKIARSLGNELEAGDISLKQYRDRIKNVKSKYYRSLSVKKIMNANKGIGKRAAQKKSFEEYKKSTEE